MGAIPSPRRDARERALELLYEAESKSLHPAEVVAALPLSPDPYAVGLAVGVADHHEELDAVISRHSRNWRIDRMPAVDRTVLRLAAFELGHRPDVPTAVVIDEAVELAKRFSTEESGRFVNGVLSGIAGELRRDGGGLRDDDGSGPGSAPGSAGSTGSAGSDR